MEAEEASPIWCRQSALDVRVVFSSPTEDIISVRQAEAHSREKKIGHYETAVTQVNVYTAALKCMLSRREQNYQFTEIRGVNN